MEAMNNDVLDGIPAPIITRRRKLLPVWIKIFTWIFMIVGMISPIAVVMGILNIPVSLSLYGVASNDARSLTGILVTALFLIKGITAVGLWTERDWAITAALADAVLGIVVCTLVVIYPFINRSAPFNSLRLELLFLIPYLVKMIRIKTAWHEAAAR